MKTLSKVLSAFVCGFTLFFTGCSYQKGPDPVPVLLTEIKVTSVPSKTEYVAGESFDSSGIKVMASYSNGLSIDVTDNVSYTGFDSSIVTECQTITVSYLGKTATFDIVIKANFKWYNTPEPLAAGTDGTYGTSETYVYFGVWPKDVVSEEQALSLELEKSTIKVTRGYLEFVKGKDGWYYVKCAEKGYAPNIKYNDGTVVKQGGTDYRWFKVMPIKWRVADSNYKDYTGTEKGKLLIAENIITSNIPFYESTGVRTISSKEIYSNNYEHSQTRAYLNGISYIGASGEVSDWTDKGFLQSAFDESVKDSIVTVTVDNTIDSTKPFGNSEGYTIPDEKYICSNTQDKIFLLSEYEITKYSKSSEPYNAVGNSRIRKPTDFSKANYAESVISEDKGIGWVLRSPHAMSMMLYGDSPVFVAAEGQAYGTLGSTPGWKGIVPALVINF